MFHPKYAENHWVYVFANGPPDTEPNKENRILRYTVKDGLGHIRAFPGEGRRQGRVSQSTISAPVAAPSTILSAAESP